MREGAAAHKRPPCTDVIVACWLLAADSAPPAAACRWVGARECTSARARTSRYRRRAHAASKCTCTRARTTHDDRVGGLGWLQVRAR